MSKPINTHVVGSLVRLGIDPDDAASLIRASRRLSRFAELECNGEIQRDEFTGAPYYYSAYSGKRLGRARDTERAALIKAESIMQKYPNLFFYHQGDPRGAALYVGRNEDLKRWEDRGIEIDSVYSTVCVPVY